MAKLGVGDKAPDFSMIDQDGNTVSLASFQGKSPVVLIFYPGDETPGCTAQLCAARNSIDEYRKAGVLVYGVNQAGPEKHKKFVQKHNLETPLLVDKNYEVSAKYDALMSLGPIKLINRTVVGIDETGKIVFYQRGMPSTDKILSAFLKKPVS